MTTHDTPPVYLGGTCACCPPPKKTPPAREAWLAAASEVLASVSADEAAILAGELVGP